MKVTFFREPLLAAFGRAARAAAARDIKPALRCVKLSADGAGGVTLHATDLEAGLRVSVPGAEIETPGEALLPAESFSEILRESRDARLEVSLAGGVHVLGLDGTLEFVLPAADVSSFPEFPECSGASHDMPASTLALLLARTSFAAAAEGQRYAMAGVRFELGAGSVRLVGTDGKRLSVAEAALDSPEESAQRLPAQEGFVLPRKSVKLLAELLAAEPGGDVRVCSSRTEALFAAGGSSLYSRLVEGRFPDYRAVVPRQHAGVIVLDAELLARGVRQAAIMSEADASRVSMAFSGDRLTLTAAGASTGRSRVEMPAGNEAGLNVSADVDPRFLLDYLKVAAGCGDVQLALTAADRPLLFDCGAGWSYVVMPLSAN